jgi:AcrR family transcriptional regulator
LARFTRTDWLELATRLLAEEGPSGLVIERLTEAAGRTRGSFYHHFESRDAFLAALIEHWRDKVMEQIAQAYRDDPSPAAIKALLRQSPETLNHRFEREVRRLAASEPVVRAGLKRVDEERICGTVFLRGLVRQGAEDPEAMAIIQYAVLVGLQWLLDVDEDPRLPAIKRVAARLFGLEDD